GDEAAEAVADHIDLVGAGRVAQCIQGVAELGRKPLKIDPRSIGKAREVQDSTCGEEAAEGEEVRRIPEEAMDEHDRNRVRSAWVESLVVANEPAKGRRQSQRRKGRDLGPQRSPAWLPREGHARG